MTNAQLARLDNWLASLCFSASLKATSTLELAAKTSFRYFVEPTNISKIYPKYSIFIWLLKKVFRLVFLKNGKTNILGVDGVNVYVNRLVRFLAIFLLQSNLKFRFLWDNWLSNGPKNIFFNISIYLLALLLCITQGSKKECGVRTKKIRTRTFTTCTYFLRGRGKIQDTFAFEIFSTSIHKGKSNLVAKRLSSYFVVVQ